MNIDFATMILKRIGRPALPNGESDFIEHPNPSQRRRDCVEIGFVIEHRFAFYYWLACKKKLQRDRRTNEIIDDRDFVPPDLVTWDWHDDVGGKCDFIDDELLQLNQADEEEVALFCWAGLRQLDDGQIAPAIWLNAIGNVYVIQKQYRNFRSRSRSFEDRFGKEHQIIYCQSLDDFVQSFAHTNTGNGVIWDIDMDFFTRGNRTGKKYSGPLSGTEIKRVLSPRNDWMPLMLFDLKAITIALEPKYTGGLSISLELYRHWESALFTAPVFSNKCKWRKEIANRLTTG